MSDLYWLTDEQMVRLRPYFPKSHGKPRVDDRWELRGIVFVNRNGLRWRDTPIVYDPHKTLNNRWKRWGGMGVFLRVMEGLPAADADPKTVMIVRRISKRTARHRACELKKGISGARLVALKAVRTRRFTL